MKRERQRISGLQDQLSRRYDPLLAQIPQQSPARFEGRSPRRSLPVRLADDETKPKWDFHLPLPPFASKNQGMVQIDSPGSAPSSASPAARSGDLLAEGGDSNGPGVRPASAGSDTPLNAAPDSVVRGAAPRYAGEPEAGPDPASVPMLASSARIRVTDEGGVYFGSGVVIDGTAGKSIVLTCGHILRDVKPGSQIEVDLFGGKNFHTYRGVIVKFDLDADVGLVTLQTTSNVAASPIARADDKIARGQTLLSIGCSRGELPSIERLRITMLNRYEGPDTIECTGVPVKGPLGRRTVYDKRSGCRRLHQRRSTRRQGRLRRVEADSPAPPKCRVGRTDPGRVAAVASANCRRRIRTGACHDRGAAPHKART